MAQQVSSTIARPAPRHSVTPGGRRPSTRRPEGQRPARGPRVQRADRDRGFETRGVSAGCRVQRPVVQPAARRSPVRPAGGEIRLTDRGIAVVLALGALLGLAAMLCIGVTAARVTAEPPAPQAAVALTQAPPAAATGGAPLR
ncbi:hypothetical protein [Enemella evansiae]|uniref:hypothetical protein n=2 Tax=Enemella evansiae TaxID=2016499 RepID=UPI000B96F868|nr:hypothetical protein [Enemella evansiae]OYO02233.1 hypothetical protein CGZ96_02500 [Enemella evansiae]OYO05566.1 hypothetical protein CGZ97_02275 [Enemella evansiae]TDO92804.1 hypothetical protein C8D81_0572 [Enemella evansiae]